ncbi:MAG TPA: hypothetical protein DEO87_07200, partial [Lachnospiraceae bacterium]|nr:hypothetical protein [Lachnospiraceae bacterium]
ALVKDTGLRHLNFEIHPEGSEASVVLDGMMPKEASAEAYDVTGEQADSDGETTLAAYDISIINGDDEYQPGDQPVRVEITDSRITAGKIALYHISDSGEREEVTGFEVLDGSISFDAYGFSIYKVVEISTPDDEGYSGVDITSDETAVDFTAKKVDGTEAFVYDVVSYPQNTPEASKISTKAAFEEAISQGYNGFYISSSNNTYGRFATGDVAANIGGTATRTGIKGTLSSLEIRDKYAVQTSNNNVDTVSLTGKAEAVGAVRYHFEAAGDDSYYIYCLGDSGVKMYVYNSNIAGSYNSLAMTEDKNAAMKYKVADHGAAGNIEIICVDDACSDWRWQYTNTNVNGFVSRNSGNNDSKLWLWYCEKPESDPLGIDGKTYGLVNASVASDFYPAVMASSRNQGSNVKQLGAAPVAAATNPDGNSCFTSAYGISGWKFEWIEGTRLYKISVIADDGASKKYLKIVNGELSFVESADDASMIFVSVNSGDNNKGTVGLIAANGILKRYDDNKFQGVANAYNTSTSGLDYCFYLVDVSDAGKDVFRLDGSSYGLVNAYDANQGNAVMCEYKSGTTNALANQAMWRTDTGFSFSGEITEWSFEHVDFNRYIIHATDKEGVEQYIRLDSTGVKLSETPYILTLIPGTGDYEGTVKIINTAQRCQIKNNKGSSSSQFDKEDSITKNEKDKWLTFTDVPEDQQVSDPLGIDGKTYGIVNPTYNKGAISGGYGMVGTMSSISLTQLGYDSAAGRFKIPDSLITAWTFHYTDHSNYILSTETADGEKYLRFGYGENPSLVSESDKATPVYIEAGTGDRSGMVRIMPLLDGTLSVLYRNNTSLVRETGFGNLSKDGAWHYLVDNADIFDPYSLNGKAYGLIYAADTISGNALMAADDGDTTYEKLYQIITHTNNDKTIKPVFISNDSDITEWTFICTAENIYHLKADNGKYLAVDGNNLVLTDNEDDSSAFAVVLSGDGLTLSSGGKYIGYNNGFVMSNQKVLLKPTEKAALTEDDHITYTAEIISVSDGDQAYDGRELIVYTRIWNSKDKAYEVYAIDHDGSMKKCYINGDELMWLDNEMNTLLWKLTVYHDKEGNETGYYELQNLYSGMYLYPQHDGSYFTSSAKGIQLPGRLFKENDDSTKTYGEFYSDIIAWDDDYYSYAALKGVPKLDSSNNIKSVELQTAYMYGSDKSFYFAVPEIITQDEDEFHRVDTIDNNLYGITMKMIDFDPHTPNNTKADNSSVTWDYFGYNKNDQNGKKGILSKNLDENGQPTVTFSYNEEQIGKTFDAFAGANEVNHLFIQSIYEASGYFEFDSTQNTATLVGEDGTFGKDFTVYRELGTHDAASGNTRKHGQFFPYNTIKPGVYSDANPQNLYTALAALLPDSDPRKYEKLHHFLAQDSNGEWTVKDHNKLDYYFGMEIEASFVQTPSGVDSWGHDIIFEFTGDDDFWLYVDGVLAIDLGGIHPAQGAKVNFRDGTITYPVGGNDSLPKTLREAFTAAYREKNPDATDSEISTYLDQYFDGEVFKDYTQHTMKIFYMERGAGASNLHMRFNLSSVTEGKVLFAKSLTDMDGNELDESEVDLDKLKFPFQIEYALNNHNAETNTDEPGEWQLLGRYNIDADNNATPSVSYHNSTQTVEFANEYISPNRTDHTYNNVFFLVPGKPLEIVFPEDAIWYRITECAVDTSIYGIELADGEIVEEGVTGSIKDLKTKGSQVKIQPTMNFKNKIDTRYIRNLDITKRLYSDREKENKLTYEEDQTTFDLRLYISDGTSDEVEPANLQSYYVLDPEGYLCVRNVETKSFERYKISNGDVVQYVLGADVKTLTAEEKAKVTFHTSSYGAISKIPAGYTVRVPGLVAGTRFFIDERDYEIPVGYDLIDYDDGKMGRVDENPEPSYTHVSTYKLNGETITLPENKKASAGIITQNYDPLVDVNNVKGWGIKAEKIWSDSDFVDKHDTVYLAVYTRDGPDDEPTLVEGTVRALASGKTEMRWYFDSLAAEKSISDYVVYEVTLTEPHIDNDGTVRYSGEPVRIEGGETIKLSVTDKGSASSVKDDYTVTYSEPVLSEQNNAISEKVNNDRKRGIKIRLNEWNTGDGEDIPLADGTFELKRNGEVIGTYTSDEAGVVTTMYGFKDNDVYTITEVKSPTGYVALKEPLVFKVTEQGTSYTLSEWTNSNDKDDDTDTSDGKNWAEYVTDDTVYNAVIDIYNPKFVLRAVKVDSRDRSMILSGVHFELHRQVVSSITGAAMDTKPMTGYEDLVSDDEGIIDKINSQLPPGVYYLVETQALDGYRMMEPEDAIQFRITDNGDVEMVREDQEDFLSVKEGTYQMTISVPNTRSFVTLTVTKSVAGSMGDRSASFEFTVKAGSPAHHTSYKVVDSTAAEPKIKEGEMMSFSLSDGQSFSLTVPADVELTVTEDNAGYSTTMKAGDDDAVSGSECKLTLQDDTVLAVTNTLRGVIPTGVYTSLRIEIILFIVIVSFMVILMVKRRKEETD